MSLILCHPYDVTIKIFSFPQRVEKVEVSKKDLNEKRSGDGPAWEQAEYWNRAEKVEVSRGTAAADLKGYYMGDEWIDDDPITQVDPEDDYY